MVEQKPPRTLWMLEYDDCNGRHLEPFYATSQEDAVREAFQWMEQQPRALVYVGIRAYPKGFIVQYGRGLRGSI